MEKSFGRRYLSRRDFLTMMSAISAGGVLSACATDPVTGRSTMVGLSPQEEVAIDRQQSPHQFSADYGVSQDAKLNAYLTDVGRRMALLSHRPEMPYNFHVVNANYVNAYAFPAGSIAATRGILLKLDSEDELAGLLGHELGHVNARHAAEKQASGMLAQMAVGIAAIATEATVGNGYGGLVAGLGGAGAGALLSHYSRENEREADALGLVYMDRAQYNPAGMLDLMDMLNSESKRQPSMIELMFSTHPMSTERVANTQRALDSTYRQNAGRKKQIERYKDHTASLRKLAPAIELQQQGETAAMKKDYAQAESSFKQALKKAPQDYTGLVLMAKVLLAQEKTKDAESYLAQATKVYPNEAQAHQLLGMTALQNGKPDRAYAAFQNYDRVLPGDPNASFFKGLSLEMMEDRPRAAEEYSRYLTKVNQGKMAQHAYGRLRSWGYAR